MAVSNMVTEDIKNLLVSGGVGTFGGTTAWSIAIGKEPDLPDEVVTLYDTAGEAPNPKFLLDYPRFQVRVRAKEYAAGYVKAEEVKSVLLGLPSQDVGGTRYVGIWATSDTQFLMADDRGRSIFVNNWRLIREPNTGANRQPL